MALLRKLSDEQVVELANKYLNGGTLVELSEEVKVSSKYLSEVLVARLSEIDANLAIKVSKHREEVERFYSCQEFSRVAKQYINSDKDFTDCLNEAGISARVWISGERKFAKTHPKLYSRFLTKFEQKEKVGKIIKVMNMYVSTDLTIYECIKRVHIYPEFFYNYLDEVKSAYPELGKRYEVACDLKLRHRFSLDENGVPKDYSERLSDKLLFQMAKEYISGSTYEDLSRKYSFTVERIRSNFYRRLLKLSKPLCRGVLKKDKLMGIPPLERRDSSKYDSINGVDVREVALRYAIANDMSLTDTAKVFGLPESSLSNYLGTLRRSGDALCLEYDMYREGVDFERVKKAIAHYIDSDSTLTACLKEAGTTINTWWKYEEQFCQQYPDMYYRYSEKFDPGWSKYIPSVYTDAVTEFVSTNKTLKDCAREYDVELKSLKYFIKSKLKKYDSELYSACKRKVLAARDKEQTNRGTQD